MVIMTSLFYTELFHMGVVRDDVTGLSLPVLCLSTQMKFEGKIRRLLGDEFQEKVSLFHYSHCSPSSLFSLLLHFFACLFTSSYVSPIQVSMVIFLLCLQVPFLSPLEGNIYLHLDSESHSNVSHQGFLVS